MFSQGDRVMLFTIKHIKSIVLIISFVFFSLYLSSDEPEDMPNFVQSTWFCDVLIKDSTFYVFDYIDLVYDSFTQNDIKYYENGYCSINLFGEECIFISGGNAFFFKSPREAINGIMNPLAGSKFAPLGVPLFETPEFYTAGFFAPGIQSVKASSYLSETMGNTNIEYRPENMLKFFWTDETSYPVINIDVLPWVEGVSGSGVGEKLNILFKGSFKKGTDLYSKGVSDNIVILNGYVDVNRMDLYKKNNRLKTIRITSTDPDNDFSMDYNFRDVVAFHEIIFPVFVSGVEITILDVYPGSKWDDTCITTLFTRLPNQYKGKQTESLFITKKLYQP